MKYKFFFIAVYFDSTNLTGVWLYVCIQIRGRMTRIVVSV